MAEPNPPRKKVGFFSRLFEAKHVEESVEPEEAASSAAEAPDAEGAEEAHSSAHPGEPSSPSLPLPHPGKKKGFLEKFVEVMETPVFGTGKPKKKAEEDEVAAEERPLDDVVATPEVEGAELEGTEGDAQEEREFSAFEATVAAMTRGYATEEAPEEARAQKSWFTRLRDRLGKTRENLMGQLKAIFSRGGLDEEAIEDIEAVLIQSDVSLQTTQKILGRMQEASRRREKAGQAVDNLELFKDAVRELLVENSVPFQPQLPESGPYVVLVIGVNGAGKTTTIAKMAKRCIDNGLSTMLVAGDTFRAAAVEQLEIWSKRTGADFMRAPYGSDAAALCFQAMDRALARGTDVVFIDTAGRLQSKSSLMAELEKIRRVLEKKLPGAPHETLLVLDATTGQNAVQQVKVFSETVPVTGLVMTKLDGTAKGGVLLTVLDLYNIPITLIGVGEAVGDLRDFDPEQFAAALFGEEEAKAEMAGR